MKILVTGTAGFIGYHVAKTLLKRGDEVVGFDSVNDYYDVNLKEARLQDLESFAQISEGHYEFIKGNLADQALVNKSFSEQKFDRVIHLAAQAGVRHSITHPHSYIESNINGFINILEACRHFDIEHLTYASSSSVYGANTTMPFSEQHGVNHPLQLYAATKRSNELMAHSYANLFKLPSTGLRFFTVYGPWGRPDMALFLFTKNILEGKPINVHNNGHHLRDFTYIDDIVEGVIRSSDLVATSDPKWNSDAPNPSTSNAPFRLYNIGNNNPVNLIAYIEAIENEVGKRAIKNLLPLQPGDVPNSYADTSALEKATGYKPSTTVELGVKNFVEWFKNYYSL